MGQMTVGDAGYAGKRKKTRREMLLEEIHQVAPWKSLIEPFYPIAGRGRHPWHFGMKMHIGVDADFGLMYSVTTTPANEADVEAVDELLHWKEAVVHAYAGYAGTNQHVRRKDLTWQIAAKRGRIKAMAEGREKRRLERTEKAKASVRAKVEHPSGRSNGSPAG